MKHWLDNAQLDECKRQIREGLAAKSKLMAEIVDALVEEQLRIVPALAEIVSSESPPGRTCDLRRQMRDLLGNEVRRLRFNPELAELIIDIQMRLVPKLLRDIDDVLAARGL
jgi:hypothetical protein